MDSKSIEQLFKENERLRQEVNNLKKILGI